MGDRLTFLLPRNRLRSVNDPAERRALSPRAPVGRARILGLPGTVELRCNPTLQWVAAANLH